MIATPSKDYSHLPKITEGDEAFREQFLSWDLGDLTMTDIRNYLQHKDIVLVPVASLEQHGPHLPLYTDTVTALHMSMRVAHMIAILHTPPIWMGYSPQHMHDPGQGRGDHHCAKYNAIGRHVRCSPKPYPPWIQPHHLRKRAWIQYQSG